MEKTFDVEIITPDRVFYKGTADLLEFNTESGEIGVYRDHIPLTTVLEPGLVTIHHGDEEQVAAVHAGFAEILGDKVTLLAELAEWPEEIDLERVSISENGNKREGISWEYPPSFMDFYTGVWYNRSSKFVYK